MKKLIILSILVYSLGVKAQTLKQAIYQIATYNRVLVQYADTQVVVNYSDLTAPQQTTFTSYKSMCNSYVGGTATQLNLQLTTGPVERVWIKVGSDQTQMIYSTLTSNQKATIDSVVTICTSYIP